MHGPMNTYLGLEVMHPGTLHGVGVITKMYFVNFAAFKESVTLNLAQTSFKVIHFGRNRKPLCSSTPAKIWGVPFGIDA